MIVEKVLNANEINHVEISGIVKESVAQNWFRRFK